jgi:hypothetical protein
MDEYRAAQLACPIFEQRYILFMNSIFPITWITLYVELTLKCIGLKA